MEIVNCCFCNYPNCEVRDLTIACCECSLIKPKEGGDNEPQSVFK